MYRQEHDGPLAELLGWTCIKTDLAVNMGLRPDPAGSWDQLVPIVKFGLTVAP